MGKFPTRRRTNELSSVGGCARDPAAYLFRIYLVTARAEPTLLRSRCARVEFDSAKPRCGSVERWMCVYLCLIIS